MNCNIKWNSLSLAEWQERFATIRRANLLQSYAYAQAACPLYRQRARWGLILLDGQEAGLVQIMEAGLFKNLIHGLILDRGPLWFDGCGTPAQQKAFFAEFNRQFPRRWGRKRRIISETVDPSVMTGYKKIDRPGYQTIWLDLDPDEETLRKNLKAQWRNKLAKAEKAGLAVEWDDTGAFFSLLLRNYLRDQATKGYDGPSADLLIALAKNFGTGMLIGRAKWKDQTVASIMILCHGQSATYQVGWSLEPGRKVAAHNFLLWQAVLELKKRNIRDLDLGGINDESAKGVKAFKQGMGGQEITLAGHYA